MPFPPPTRLSPDAHPAPAAPAPAGATQPPAIPTAETVVGRLLEGGVLAPEKWDELPAAVRQELLAGASPADLLDRLARRGLITPHQAEMCRTGRDDDLVLGQYLLVEPLGRGGMGTVYRAEHRHLRKPVALKVMSSALADQPKLLQRFYAEARAVAALKHPNIVACMDAGRHESPSRPPRDYYVMELIDGQDLHTRVALQGPLAPEVACDLFRQIAEALAEAHRHGLIHRDLKPGNVIVTADGRAKLLDFGLALNPSHRSTEPGTLLGTLGYMAPEQARDPHLVDPRADLFSLGATLYWALTGREPYPETGNVLKDLHVRLAAPPLDLFKHRPESPPELAELIARLTERDPDKRYPSAHAVAAALGGIGRWIQADVSPDLFRDDAHRVLVADDDPAARAFARAALREFECHEAADGPEAWRMLAGGNFDLLILDINLPGLCGTEFLAGLRDRPPCRTPPPVMVVSGAVPVEALAGLTLQGADDFLEKPFSPGVLLARARAILERATRRDTVELPANEAVKRVRETMRVGAADLIRRPAAESVADAPAPRGETVLTAAGGPSELLTLGCCRLLEEIGLLTPGYHDRMRRYVRAIAAVAGDRGEYARLKDVQFLKLLCNVAPLHDLGNLVIPTSVLLKPAGLDAEELAVVQAHTVTGSEMLTDLVARAGAPLPELTLGVEVVRHHHERWDGTGYPDGLAGESVPLSARLVAVASVYESLRTRRPHRPALSHARAVRLIAEESPGAYDPTLLAAFRAAAPRLDEIFQTAGRG